MFRISRPAAFAAGAVLGISLLSTTVASASSGSRSDDEGGGSLLRAPIQGSLVADPPLFGATPGGAPWVISKGKARLSTMGKLEVEVKGLVIPPSGVNPLPRLSATVVCSGTRLTPTASVPFSPAGNAEIEATVMLPARCLAPAVLLSPGSKPDTYIAATGR